MADNREITVHIKVDEVEFKVAEAWIKRITNDVQELANAFARLELTANYARHAVANAPKAERSR